MRGRAGRQSRHCCWLALSHSAGAQVCRISVAGLNQSRRVTGAVHTECPQDPIHTVPFGNWGVTSNFGQKGDSHQFDGWCHDAVTCDNAGACRTSCTDGWYEWNSCTDDARYRAPNCSLYNSAGCTEQATVTGINVHGTRTIDLPVSCSARHQRRGGVPGTGGCKDVTQYSSGTNFMSLGTNWHPGLTCDELVQTVDYSAGNHAALACDSLGCVPVQAHGSYPRLLGYAVSTPLKVFAQMAVVVKPGAPL